MECSLLEHNLKLCRMRVQNQMLKWFYNNLVTNQHNYHMENFKPSIIGKKNLMITFQISMHNHDDHKLLIDLTWHWK
jgi:hypothetical protein